MPSPLSKTRLKCVRSRPVRGLLVRGSSPMWHIPSSGCVTAALCGVIVTFGCSQSTDAVGKGSVANTSATICESQPRSRAASAAWLGLGLGLGSGSELGLGLGLGLGSGSGFGFGSGLWLGSGLARLLRNQITPADVDERGPARRARGEHIAIEQATRARLCGKQGGSPQTSASWLSGGLCQRQIML